MDEVVQTLSWDQPLGRRRCKFLCSLKQGGYLRADAMRQSADMAPRRAPRRRSQIGQGPLLYL